MPTRFDLLIFGGIVVDPGSSRHEPADVGIRAGRIAEITPNLALADADRVIDATGCLVTPGLIDFHVHAFWGVNMYGIDIDRVCLAGGVTTAVDAGSSGSINFPGFRRFIAEPARTRVLAFVCVAKHGVMHAPGELVDLTFADVDGTAKTITTNRDVAVGVKVRVAQHHVHDNGQRALDLAIEAGEASGTPVMVHIGDSRMSIEDIVDSLRPGDIVTHCYTPLTPTILDDSGRLREAVAAAHERGVLFDIGHARRHLDFQIARTAMAAGVGPAMISSDLHLNDLMYPLVVDLPSVLTKFLGLGMPLDQVIAAASSEPAKAIGWEDRIGHLEPGREADVAILELIDEARPVEDSVGAILEARPQLIARWTIRGGLPFEAGPLGGPPPPMTPTTAE